MRRHVSIFAFLLGAFSAGVAFEAGADQTVYGGHYYYGTTYQSKDAARMTITGLGLGNKLAKANTATCAAHEPDGMKVSDWGYVETDSTTVNTDITHPKDTQHPKGLVWADDDASVYYWTNESDRKYAAIAVRFDYIAYTLKFASTRGGTMPTDIATTYEKLVAIPSPSSAPTGYHFVKWVATSSFDAGFSKDVSAGSSVNGEGFGLAGCHADGSVITLTAQWAANAYAVSNMGENCTVTVGVSADYDENLLISWNPDGSWKKPTVTVYSGADDKGTRIRTYSDLPEDTKSVVFKMSDFGAYYDKIFVKVSYDVYTLTFDPNGGTCDETSRRVERGAYVGTLPIPRQYLKQYDGWYDDRAHGNQITAQTKYEWTKDVTVYAQWEDAEAVTITTIAAPEVGGTVTGGGQFEKGVQTTLTATPSNGYSFVKWTAKTSGEEFAEREWTIAVNGNEEYTAHFTGNVYSVRFDCDEDLAERAQVTCPKSIKLTYGDPFGDLPAAIVGNSDYRFVCWMFEDETEITPDTIFMMSGKNNYIYAKVVLRPTYAICYNGNGETSGSMVNQKMYCGVADNLTSNAYKRIGYHFRGWATNTADAAALEIAYADGALVTDIASTNETLTLYAAWEAITLGEAMHCNDTNLVWDSMAYYPTSVNEWTPEVGANIGYHGDSCVQQIGTGGNLGIQQWMQTRVLTNGHLSFKWKPSGENGEIAVTITTKDDGPGKEEYKLIPYMSSEWQTYETDIPKGYYVKIANSGSVACSIDQMTWTPGGPMPGPTDAVKISSVEISGGKFKLYFKSNRDFDYNLLTNANLLVDSWGVMTNVVGTGGTMYFEPEIIEGQPQLFYRVDTIQKKD